jgi:hypothetical protein
MATALASDQETCIEKCRLGILVSCPCLGLAQGTLLHVDMRARSLAAYDCRLMPLLR